MKLIYERCTKVDERIICCEIDPGEYRSEGHEAALMRDFTGQDVARVIHHAEDGSRIVMKLLEAR